LSDYIIFIKIIKSNHFYHKISPILICIEKSNSKNNNSLSNLQFMHKCYLNDWLTCILEIVMSVSDPWDIAYGKYKVRVVRKLLNKAIDTNTIWAVIVWPSSINATKHKNIMILDETKNSAIFIPRRSAVLLIFATSLLLAISTSFVNGFSHVYTINKIYL